LPSLKITTLGIVLALKNLGTWLATLVFTDVINNPQKFAWMLIVYVMINVPTDLLLVNHASDRAVKEALGDV